MKGWLIYDRAGATRNKEFIRFWFQAAQSRGVELELIIVEDGIPTTPPDFAVVRTMNSKLSYELENMGITVYNSAYVSYLCNDKWKTYCLAEIILTIRLKWISVLIHL